MLKDTGIVWSRISPGNLAGLGKGEVAPHHPHLPEASRDYRVH